MNRSLVRSFVGFCLGVLSAFYVAPALANGWFTAIEQNPMTTRCAGIENIPVAGATDCPSALVAAGNLFRTLQSIPRCMSAPCPSGSVPKFTNSCTPEPYTRPSGAPAMRWQIGVRWVCQTCLSKQDLSTGVGNWMVRFPHGAVQSAHKINTPLFGWANTTPLGGAFPPGTTWIQANSSPVAIKHDPGTYVYKLRFHVPECALDANGFFKIRGWFAADNSAILSIDGSPGISCSGDPSYCFLQRNVTSFSRMVQGSGVHMLEFKVYNLGRSPSGLLAHIVTP
jgi:hypothetical protein